MTRYYLFLLVTTLLYSCGSESNLPEDESATASTPTTQTATHPSPPAPEEKKLVGKPTLLSGTINGIDAGKRLFFDRKTLDATDVVAITELKAGGQYDFTAGVPTPGIYRLRLGAVPVYLLLEGGEEVTINATLDGYKLENYTVSGSLYTEEMKEWGNKPEPQAVKKYLSETQAAKPLLHLYLVEKLDLAVNIDLYKKVLKELQTAYPNDLYTKQFKSKVLYTENKINAQPVAVGRTAPEINLPSLNGKKIALSSLKGKVVLLDFWASWCRPCRNANPHVVEMYNKYKKKGFTVYNVSLDGIDDRTMARFKSNPAALEQATNEQRKKWEDAVKVDRLTWKNHVSDLRGWSSPVAALYGVNSIPRTFVLDREGKIRYTNLRGPQLEEAIVTLLEE